MSSQTAFIQPSEPELATAVSENLFAFFRAMATTLSGGEIVEGDSLCYHHAFPSNPMFKGVWQTRLANEDVDGAIEQILTWFRARNAPFVFWWVGLDTEPSNLAERLEVHGFMQNIAGDPGMAVNLDELSAEMPTPDGFRVVQATTPKMVEDWRDTFTQAFQVPSWAGQGWMDATLRAGIENAPWRLYLGYLNDKPVATNILFNGAGVASVYGVATLPEVRGKGIGTAITRAPLLDARAQGYRYAVLFATEMGFSVYQRLGFRPVNCKIGRYLWFNRA